MSWHHIFEKANKAAQAAVDDKLNDAIDPKIQIGQAIEEAQRQFGELKAASAVVMANYERTTQRRGQLQRQLDQLGNSIKSAKAAIDSATNDTEKTRRTNQARSFAMQYAQVQDELAHIDEQLPALKEASDAAQHHCEDFAQVVTEKMRERTRLLSDLDQAKADEHLNAALKTMSDLTGSSTVPTFAQVEDKIEQRKSVAHASVALNAADPSLAELDAHVQERHDQADAILASFDTPALPQGNPQ